MRLGLLVVIPLLLQGCTLFGVMVLEQPQYKTLEVDGDFEIREYPDYYLVETIVQGEYSEASDEAFRRLFDYISGENQQATKISMTSPVIMQAESARPEYFSEKTEDGWKMSFVVPARYFGTGAPQPSQSLVQIRKVPAHRLAAVQFSGRWRLENFNEESDRLLQWIKGRGFSPASKPRAAAYNPPWTLPFLRRNEILMDIED